MKREVAFGERDLIRGEPFLQLKSCFIIKEVASLEGNNLQVFYYVSAPEVWPDKRGDLIREVSVIEIHYKLRPQHQANTCGIILKYMYSFNLKC